METRKGQVGRAARPTQWLLLADYGVHTSRKKALLNQNMNQAIAITKRYNPICVTFVTSDA
ncbi:MAG: hypothetical protein V7K92_12215 [Nostoc sp.]|uniref:hypothetical protein n=1 Tax=Nostoc sp. TaxID=1180 RepID=UPI002FF2E310